MSKTLATIHPANSREGAGRGAAAGRASCAAGQRAGSVLLLFSRPQRCNSKLSIHRYVLQLQYEAVRQL